MHVGNLRTALYAYFFARQNHGTYILRIEDTDVERFVEGATETIFRTLKMANMTYDEGPGVGGDYGPYVQSERKPLYEKYAKELIAKGAAYYCFCDKERLESLRDEHGNARYDRHCLNLSEEEINAKLSAGIPYVIRQKMPTEGKVPFDDLLYGTIEVDATELEDQILLKSDKMPTYNFANVVDDHTMHITHVMRGKEYLSSTPKYNLLYDAFGWEKPKYIHLSPIMRDETHKLSKRYGDANFEDFINKGFLPHAIVNYICLLGWAPKDNEEKFTIEELIERFSIDGLKKSGSIFDQKKLEWLNGEYLKEFDEDQFVSFVKPFLIKAGIEGSDEWYRSLILLFRDRTLFGAQIVELYHEFFRDEILLNDETKEIMADATVNPTLKALYEAFGQINGWNEENIGLAIKNVGKATGVKGKMLYMPARIATTGEMHGPDLGKSLVVLGKEKTLLRLQQMTR
jgi:glutamyl-tRNA synthetase